MLPSNHFILFEDRAVVEIRKRVKNLSTMFADVHFFDCHYKRGVLASYYFLFMIAIKIMRHLL